MSCECLQKDSEFALMFTYHILKMEQSGLIDRIRHKWMDSADNIYERPMPPTLGFESVIFLFALLLLGALAAGIIIYFEFLAKRRSPLRI